MAHRICQISLFTDILELLGKKHGVKGDASTRQINAVVDAANRIVEEFGRDDVVAKAGEGLQAWLRSDDTGLSSRFMARTLGPLIGERVPAESVRWDGVHYPRDPDDLGRCLRLLKAAPALRDHLPAMSATHPVWAKLVEAWAELEALYNEELAARKGRKTYERMKACGC